MSERNENVSAIVACKGCGKSIRFIRTEKNERMPVDANAEVRVTEAGRVVKLYVPHWGNCTQADMFRRKVGEG